MCTKYETVDASTQIGNYSRTAAAPQSSFITTCFANSFVHLGERGPRSGHHSGRPQKKGGRSATPPLLIQSMGVVRVQKMGASCCGVWSPHRFYPREWGDDASVPPEFSGPPTWAAAWRWAHQAPPPGRTAIRPSNKPTRILTSAPNIRITIYLFSVITWTQGDHTFCGSR